MLKIKILFLIFLLILITGCTSGSLSDEDINKIATNPLIKAQIQSFINNNCYKVNKSTDGVNTYYDIKVESCNSWEIRNTSEGVKLVQNITYDYITSSTTTTSTTTVEKVIIDIDSLPLNKTREFL